ERGLDLPRRPFAEAEIARLAGAYDLGQRLHRLLERRRHVVAVALVEIDVVGAQPRERIVDLLVHLLAREPAVAVHREEELRCANVGIAPPGRENLAEELLSAPARVHVRSVEEVDPDLERLFDAGDGAVTCNAAAVGQPRAEADLRDLEVRRSELAVTHGSVASIAGLETRR